MSLVTDIFDMSEAIKDGRSADHILAHLMSEVGELAQEVIIAEGRSYKPLGADGVVGEAIDVIVCAVDIIKYYESLITEDELQEICKIKLNKWRSVK